MKTKFYARCIYLFLMAGAIYSCKSVNKLYQNGDYDQAVYTAVKKMGKHKLTPQTKSLIADAYHKAILQYEVEINYLIQSQNLYKWEPVLDKYYMAQKLSNAILKSPEALQYVTPKDYTMLIQTAKDNAVSVRKQRGLYLMDQQSKIAAQHAYQEFATALQIDGDHRELADLKEEAFRVAVTNIMMEPIQTGYYNQQYEMSDLENRVLCDLQQSNSNRFVKYFNTYQANQHSIRIDHSMELLYDGIDKDRVNTNTYEKDLRKDNVLLREITIRQDSIVREYGTVYAKFFTYTEKQNYRGKIRLQIKDMYTNQIILRKQLEAEYCLNHTYAKFTGDERALSQEQKNELAKGRNFPNISQQEISRNLNESLSRKIQDALRYFWN